MSHYSYLRKEDQHIHLSTSQTVLRPRLGSKRLEMYHKLSCEHLNPCWHLYEYAVEDGFEGAWNCCLQFGSSSSQLS